MKEAIRLTNKTAIALRKNAKKVRTAYFAAAVIVSVLLGAAGVVLGFLWLPAVPMMIAAIALIDCALMTASRSRYLSLLGQAICTEAAARDICADRSEIKRREQAVKDLMDMKADMGAAMEKKPGAQPFFEKKKEDEQEEDEDILPQAAAPKANAQSEAEAPRRRRRQSPLTLIRSEQAK
ncbi:MAG: hypothetical protein IJ313_06900 [Clostridia bacterium]|nr:hypothetical protein [Clostridia bacterium]